MFGHGGWESRVPAECVPGGLKQSGTERDVGEKRGGSDIWLRAINKR